MSGEIFYNPRYDNSHALIIGINRYQSVPPLAHARNDAEAVAATLHARFGFPNENIAILLDEKATRAAISTAFLRFANNSVTRPDDRLIVFYAGHGHTMSGRTREVGFLVPVDVKIDDLSTLIRWDELTRNADLIQAKHIFFMMDAWPLHAKRRRQVARDSSRICFNVVLAKCSLEEKETKSFLMAAEPGWVIRYSHRTCWMRCPRMLRYPLRFCPLTV
jgi:hypothetical protein